VSAVDYYDVQAMIRDARSEIRGEISNEGREIRAALREEIDELRNEIASLQRVLNSRTEHLA